MSTVAQLLKHIEALRAVHPDIDIFEVVTHNQAGELRVGPEAVSVGVALSQERLVSIGCAGFVLREDIPASS